MSRFHESATHRLRLTVALMLIAGLVSAFAMVTPTAPVVKCLWADDGCGTGSNLCRYDCPGSMNCARSGDPFEMCKCASGMCSTVACPDPG
jgi:hypothetical protein